MIGWPWLIPIVFGAFCAGWVLRDVIVTYPGSTLSTPRERPRVREEEASRLW